MTIFLKTLVQLVFFAAAVGSPSLPATAADAPRIKCEISMESWCIAQFDGKIEMRDSNRDRVWSLTAHNTAGPPLTLIESKSCSDSAADSFHLIQREQIQARNQIAYEIVSYQINLNGCKLKFIRPLNESGGLYQQIVLFGILVGSNKRTQLYRIVE